jgi:hypothetical protein
MKKLVGLSCMVLLLVFALMGCSSPPAEIAFQDDVEDGVEQQAAAALSQAAAQTKSKIYQGKDYTVKVSAYDIGSVLVTSVSSVASGSSLPYPCQTVSELDSRAPIIVAGTIVNREFFAFDGAAYTKLDVEVSASIKGELVPKDKISVIRSGGYILIADIVAARDNASRFADVPEEQWAITYRAESMTGQEFPAVGEKYAFFLQPDESISGSYSPVNDYEGTFRMGTDGRYARYNPSEGYVPTTTYSGDRYDSKGNSVIDSFTLDELRHYFG